MRERDLARSCRAHDSRSRSIALATSCWSPRSSGRAGHGALDVAGEILDPVGADRNAEVLGGDVLELVRLVQDGVGVRRDHRAVGTLPHGGIGAEQVVVDDDQVGLGGALPHPRHEALVVARALGADAGFDGGRDLIPERQIFRQVFQLGAVAGVGARGPFADDRQKDRVGHRRRPVASRPGRTDADPPGVCPGRAPSFAATAKRPAVDRRLRFTGQLIEAVQAQVVGAALHVGGGERHAERRAQRRKVLEENLFLKVLGAGRDQHPLAAEDGGDEIRERLAGAGAGFGEQDAAVLERARDRGRPCRPGRRAVRSPGSVRASAPSGANTCATLSVSRTG